jgi:hypothetical protein
MRISPKDHQGTEYLCQQSGMPTIRNVALSSCSRSGLQDNGFWGGGDLGDFTSSRRKLHMFTRQKKLQNLVKFNRRLNMQVL